MIMPADLSFSLCGSISGEKSHALGYIDRVHNVKKEIITTGRTVGGMFQPKESKTYYYVNVAGSTVHESIEEVLKELNG